MIFLATSTARAQTRIRPVDPGRDMGAIADLIEIAFAGELDRTGNSLIADMRRLAVLGPLLTIVERVTPFAGGWAWEEDGRLLGNVTVTPEDRTAQRWFVSNVAVHPDYQRRGIARQLMEAAAEGIRRRGGRQAVLQVRSENEAAQGLYAKLGFRRFDTVVEMLRTTRLPVRVAQPPLPCRRIRGGDWQALLDLARASTPAEVQRIRGLDPRLFQPSLGRCLREWLDDLLGARRTVRWGTEQNGTLAAVVSILVQLDRTPARLDLAVRPGGRGAVEGPLADLGLAALHDLGARSVAANPSTSHPEAIAALSERHFGTVRHLDQLVLEIR